jgi:hypothetical protein
MPFRFKLFNQTDKKIRLKTETAWKQNSKGNYIVIQKTLKWRKGP